MRRISDHLTRLRYLLGRHRRSVGWTALAAVLALGGGVAAGALTAGSSPVGASAAASPAPTSPAPTSPAPTGAASTGATPTGGGAAPAKAADRARRLRVTVVTVSAASWTVRTPRGATVTVAITATTRFGPRVAPGHVAPGDVVVVVGHRSGRTWTATLIVAPRSAATTPPASTPAASTPAASTPAGSTPPASAPAAG